MDMNYEVATDKSFTEAIQSIKDSLADHDFGVLSELNFQDTLRSKGVDFDQEFHLLEVCNPEKAKQVLDQHLEMAFFLPCKVGVYTKSGQTYIGMPLPMKLMGMLGNPALLEIAQEVEDVLVAAIHEAQ
ncbi:DUF302 domain-containing protein [Isachenkonia alkalipeptolytica]|uniref:DUF302 domain-containing protein n=1 Tax=Isachenkonia alkalipeptolytica TaxID=2565777 RepID=A0AA44BE65_9CLOT|nr:DUF302 domain-containing protein [Isachenkonia alkalipeptolytica]NBG88707.1 DUF302 domain-containing protein [Isachenkonia alkalipeptolytica]